VQFMCMQYSLEILLHETPSVVETYFEIYIYIYIHSIYEIPSVYFVCMERNFLLPIALRPFQFGLGFPMERNHGL
jgi:hypothetical protein